MLRSNHAVFRQNNGPFNNVLEFPHIAGPLISEKKINHSGICSFNVLAQFTGILSDKVLSQGLYIFFTLPERRKVNRDVSQFIQKICC